MTSRFKIVVGRKDDPRAQYIGRGSPLGNPYRMSGEAERDLVCDRYERWFNKKVEEKDERVMAELNRLLRLAMRGDLILGCFCCPKRCHGETVKKYLELRLREIQKRFEEEE